MTVLTVGLAIWLIIYTNKEDTDADKTLELMDINSEHIMGILLEKKLLLPQMA